MTFPFQAVVLYMAVDPWIVGYSELYLKIL